MTTLTPWQELLPDLCLLTHKRGVFVGAFSFDFLNDYLNHFTEFSFTIQEEHTNAATGVGRGAKSECERRVHETYTSEPSEDATTANNSGRISKTTLLPGSAENCAYVHGRMAFQKTSIPKNQESKPFLSYIISHGATAETLLLSIEMLGINVATVRRVLVGTGPGSFTGLRLGTAFLNGLLLARADLTIIPVPSLLPQGPSFQWLLTHTHCTDPLQKEAVTLWQDPIPLKPHDPYSSFLSVKDGLAHVWSAAQSPVLPPGQFVEPCYGKEPTPVLRLRQASNAEKAPTI